MQHNGHHDPLALPKGDMMFSKTTEVFKRSMEQVNGLNESLFQAANSCYTYGFDEYLKTLRYNSYLMNRMVEAGLIPTMKSFFEMERDISNPLIDAARGARPLQDSLKEIGGRVHSGTKYHRLVTTLGRDLFGSATFEGERVLAENRYMKLSYLPAKRRSDAEDLPAVFHVGGFLPYSDRIFRILPEANLFMPFIERGMPVYAMELKGDKKELGDLSGYTIEALIEMLDELSAVAFEHAGGKKMVIEGYCGLAMPMLSFLAAKPKQADQRFSVAFTMVAPIDGRECRILGEMLDKVPQHLFLTQFSLAQLSGGYVDGDNLRLGMDIPLGSFFPKSPFGRFMRGWKKNAFAKISSIDDLNPSQRRELAGAYWISPENCKRFPVPLDQARFTTRLWLDGIGEDLRLPYVYNGKQLDLHNIVDKTGIQLVGFYGGQDVVVPDATANILKQTMGNRYTHVVHPQAGHISYVLSPELWNAKVEGAFEPNPLELVLAIAGGKTSA